MPTEETSAVDPLVSELSDERLGERARAVLPGGYGRSTMALIGASSPFVARGSGYELVDTNGRTLIDCHNNFTSLIHGNRHPEVTAAAKAAIDRGSCFGLPGDYEIEHAEHLMARVPGAERVRYTNSGTEAVMLAIRTARAHTGRDKVVFIDRAYHGTSEPALVTGGARAKRGVPDGVSKDIILLRLNDSELLQQTIASHGESLAAVVLDLLPNRAGLQPVSPEFAREVHRICEEFGIVLISDEIISFRMSWGGSLAAHGIEPGLVTLGKVIGGGMPVGAVLGKEEIMMELDPTDPDGLEHGGTFSGNPVTMIAGRKALELFTPEEVERLNSLGERLRRNLSGAPECERWEIRGDGSLARPFKYDLDAEAQKEAQRRLWWEAYRRGVLLTQNCLAALSTPMNEAIIDEVSERLIEAIGAVG